MTHTPTLLPYAARSTRLLGQFVDGIVGIAPFLVVVALSALIPGLGSMLSIVALAWSVFYYLFADGLHGGQSFAKQWLGMQVIDAQSGAPCTFGQSLIRNLLLAILGPIDWLFIFGERHRRLGDMAAGTIVVAD